MSKATQPDFAAVQGKLSALTGGRYRLQRVLSRSGSGTVYAALVDAAAAPPEGAASSPPPPAQVAVQHVSPAALAQPSGLRAVVRGLALQRCLADQGCCFARVVAVHFDDAADDLFVVAEFVPLDLRTRLTASPNDAGWSDKHVRFLAYQLLVGLDALHRHGAAHLALRPSVLLLTDGWDLKLSHTGLARPLAAPGAGPVPVGDPPALWYHSPEQLVGSPFVGPKADMWAFGCLLAELVRRRPLFPGGNVRDQLGLVCSLVRPSATATSPALEAGDAALLAFAKAVPAGRDVLQLHPAPVECENLLRKCLRFEPEMRVTAHEALQHPFFRSVHDPQWYDAHAAALRPQQAPVPPEADDCDPAALRAALRALAAPPAAPAPC